MAFAQNAAPPKTTFEDHPALLLSNGTLELTAYECPVCGADGSVEIKLTETTKNAKGQPIVNELALISYPGEALRVFEDLPTLMQLSPANETERAGIRMRHGAH